MNKLEAVNITKTYIGQKALDNVSVTVPDRSVFGLLGPNGAGKTTLIRIINMITGPDSGEVLLDGHPLKKEDVFRIGYLPEERGLYKKMKVGEQALYLARLKGMPKAEAIKKLKIWFDRFEILSWWDKKVEELSKGMQQKVQFIVTVVHEPDLLIFDEPFSGFDPINVNLIKDEILNLKNKGATIIFSTHNMASVEELCDNIALINNGKTVLSGEIHQIKEQFKTNLYEVTYRSKKPVAGDHAEYQIVETVKKNGVYTSRIKTFDNTNNNQLLSQFIQEAEIVSFKEVLPSVNDIFLKAVQGEQNTTRN